MKNFYPLYGLYKENTSDRISFRATELHWLTDTW